MPNYGQLRFTDSGGTTQIYCQASSDSKARQESYSAIFNIAGDVTDHRDGTVSITMGRMTDLEEAYELLYGGNEK